MAISDSMLERLRALLGAQHVLAGGDVARYACDWTGQHRGTPVVVVRPGSTSEVSAVLALAHAGNVQVVPVSGNTGLVGGTFAQGGLMLSLERLNRIRALNAGTRVLVAEAGVVLSRLHDAAAEAGLYLPLWFGARGSAMIGGALSTNAGGSNVLRYGSTRGLCLGLEVVLADGRVLDLMSTLHKDNSGYDLKQMFIGAEGTLGIITAASLRLVPAAQAHATAMVACPSLPAALDLLNRLQDATGGMVEAFEFMPRAYMERLLAVRPDLGQPFDVFHEVNILVELGASAPRDCTPRGDGSLPLVALLEGLLGQMLVEELILDAVIARSQAQRDWLWARREAAAEITLLRRPLVDFDIAVPLDRVADFLQRAETGLARLDPGSNSLAVAHLGDGNVHWAAFPSSEDPALHAAVRGMVEDVVQSLEGSFSAEHGVGLTKLGTMTRRKDPVALDIMRALKATLDPRDILNPGKVVPSA